MGIEDEMGAQRALLEEAGLSYILASKAVLKAQETPEGFLEALARLCDAYLDEVTQAFIAGAPTKHLKGKLSLSEVQLEFHRYFKKHFGVSNVNQVITQQMLEGGPVKLLEVPGTNKIFLERATKE